MSIFNWKFLAYDNVVEGNPHLGTDVMVEAPNEKSAMLKAKKVLKRKSYWLRSCWPKEENTTALSIDKLIGALKNQK